MSFAGPNSRHLWSQFSRRCDGQLITFYRYLDTANGQKLADYFNQQVQSQQNRYLVQFWSAQARRFVTDCSFHDSAEQRQKAISYVNLIVDVGTVENGRLYDQKTESIIHERVYIPF